MAETWHQYIGGAWTPAADGRMRPILSPWDGRTVGEVAVGTEADAGRAVAAADEAFARTRALASHERHAILRRIHDGIAARREEFAQGIVEEAGKPIRDARAEVDRALLVFSLAADESRRVGGGDVLPLDLNAVSAGRIGITRRFPAGPVAAITPFNFPLNLVAHKVAPAFAAGCPVVLKPAEKTPLSALRLASVVQESGWPAGGLSVLTPETPETVGTLLTTDERMRVLSFTGSDKVGWRLKALAPRKRVTLELGGNAAVIVHEDADLAYSVARCVTGAFANAGQVCISVQRVFVHRPLWDDWTARFVDGVRSLRVGDPADETTDLGPLISTKAADQIAAWVDEAIAGGATALVRGERRGPQLLTPTVLTGTTPDMAVCCEETFGPVVVIEPYDTLDEALSRANDGRFGLQAGIFTRDIGRVFHAFSALEVGGVLANDVPQYRVDNMPYGGEKDSGFGREGVAYAIEEMTELRLLALNFPPQPAAAEPPGQKGVSQGSG
jgi:glyceraldehyde-3-phosphate dehydrogenase (NADP+)